MSSKQYLYKNIENFFERGCEFQKNDPFIASFVAKTESGEGLPIVFDESNSIQCILNLKKEKEPIVEESKKLGEIKLSITDSSFEIVLYKNSNSPSVIKSLILLVINDIEKLEQKDEEKVENKKTLDINSEYKLLEKLKKFIFNYIKINKKNKKTPKDNAGNNNMLETILFEGTKNDIRFFNYGANGINYENENIQKIIEIIKMIPSKLEIKQKKNENEKNESKPEDKDGAKTKSKNNNINDVLNELNPDYKNELIGRYLDEMPEEIVGLMKKYRNINFTKNMYLEYTKNIGAEQEGGNEEKNDEKDQMEEENN